MAPTLSTLVSGRAPLKFLLPVAAIAGALTFGAAPAQALTGSLAFADGTGDFFNAVDPTDPLDTFSVVFNPIAPNGQTAVSTANGLFLPDFAPAPPIYLQNVSSPTATFTWLAAAGPGALYTLDADTSFLFDNGVTIGLNAGVQFLVIKAAGGVSVDLTQNFAPSATAFVNGLSAGPVTVSDGAFTFNDTAPAGGGSYSANIDVTDRVPGPLPILGAGVAFGYSRKLRKRIQLGQTA